METSVEVVASSGGGGRSVKETLSGETQETKVEMGKVVEKVWLLLSITKKIGLCCRGVEIEMREKVDWLVRNVVLRWLVGEIGKGCRSTMVVVREGVELLCLIYFFNF